MATLLIVMIIITNVIGIPSPLWHIYAIFRLNPSPPLPQLGINNTSVEFNVTEEFYNSSSLTMCQQCFLQTPMEQVHYHLVAGVVCVWYMYDTWLVLCVVHEW